jgi:hypothetical protein
VVELSRIHLILLLHRLVPSATPPGCARLIPLGVLLGLLRGIQLVSEDRLTLIVLVGILLRLDCLEVGRDILGKLILLDGPLALDRGVRVL